MENNKNGFTPCAAGQDSKIQMLVGLAPCGGSERGSVPGLAPAHMAASNPWLIDMSLQSQPPSSHDMLFSASLSQKDPSSYKDTSH